MLDNQFDIIRHPKYNPDMFERVDELRLEFGAIMWRYVLENKGPLDWNAIVEFIAR